MPAGRSLCVLLVEDHDDTLKLMSRLLRADGHTVYTARSAEEAIMLAAAQRCDLLISDIGLQGRSGLELMRQLRSTYSLKGIAISGWTGADESQAALDAGFACYIAKPFNYEDLTQAIRAVMPET